MSEKRRKKRPERLQTKFWDILWTVCAYLVRVLFVFGDPVQCSRVTTLTVSLVSKILIALRWGAADDIDAKKQAMRSKKSMPLPACCWIFSQTFRLLALSSFKTSLKTSTAGSVPTNPDPDTWEVPKVG